jgi:hypothetical protein
MKKIVLIILLITAFACNEETKKKESNNSQQSKEPIKEFIVKMSFKTNKADEFKLMLNNIVIDEFQRKNISIIEKVMPLSNLESLTADFGDNSPNNFRINFGNKEEKEMEIESLSLFYGDNSLSMTSADLKTHFSFNRYIIQDSITYKIQSKRIDSKHYPQIVLKKKAIDLLMKE